MPAPPLPSEVAKIRERLQKDQAPSAKLRTPYFDMPTLRRHVGRPYSNQHIPLEYCYEMRTDAVIQFAQLVAMAPILMGSWSIECKNPRLSCFIDGCLRRIYGRMTLQFFGAADFGYQALVKEFGRMKPSWEYIDNAGETDAKVQKVWDEGGIDALVWDDFVPLRPENVRPLWTDSGDFDGIKLSNVGSGFNLQGVAPIITDALNSSSKLPTDAKVDIEHSLWVINERDKHFGSSWGYPRLGYSYKFWAAYEMTLGILNRSVERKGDPTIVVSFPPGKSRMPDGTERDNQEIAFEIGESARSGAILVVPSEVWGEDDKGTGSPKWKIDTIKYEDQFESLDKILRYLDVAKFRAMMVSELSVAEGTGGSSSRNVAKVAGLRTAESAYQTQLEHDAIINRYMIPQLVQANFWEPEFLEEPIRKVTKTFGEGEVQLLTTLMESFANANSDKLPVDWAGVMDVLGVPLLDTNSIAARQRELATQAEAKPPEAKPPDPAGNAGVTESGFYYGARDVITLSEDETLLASLPPTKHYEDKTVLAQTRAVRRIWFDSLTDQYESFAVHLEQSSIDLAIELADKPDDKKIKKAVDALLAGWRYPSKTYKTVIERTLTALSRVFSRAGGLELKRSNLSADDWKPEETDLAQWVKDNAAGMVRKIDSTTRKQLNTFLLAQVKADAKPAEIAKKLRQHFAEFPAWRADLIAREETKRFYNAATLFAATSAGRQVQALDARLGPTDSDCVDRDGQIFKPDQAWVEEAKEHVRGTLAWRIISSKVELSIEIVTDGDDVQARFDQETGTIFMAEGLTRAQQAEYLTQVVNWLEKSTLA